ncbi:UNVERIFIED_CONTAM: hypothetical protein Sradi_5047000 [Sesamum radiatum]|uniref:Uncharacterized protein n=1 Tax=Sesamum radiatum TaxID=300843 RepID=A0AAW2M343_SESRA
MFNKHLRDEDRVATTLPTTRSLKGTPSSSNQRGKCSAAALPGSSSKKSRPSPSALPPSGFTHFTSTLPPLHPRDLGIGSLRSSSSSLANWLYILLMLSLEMEGAFAQAADILKWALSSEDWRLMSSLSQEDLGRMLTLVLVKEAALRGEILSRRP